MITSHNLADYRFISPDIAMSTSEIRITTTSISFNITSAAELDYPERICLLVSNDGHNLAIGPWNPNIDIALSYPFVGGTVDLTSKRRVIIKNRDFVRMFRNANNFNDKKARNIPGVRYRNSKTLYFDAREARHCGEKNNRKRVLNIDDYPTFTDAIVKMQRVPFALPAGSEST